MKQRGHGLGWRYKKWGKVGYFRPNSCINFYPLYILYHIMKYSFPYIEIDMIDRITLKPRVSLYVDCFIFVFFYQYVYIKLPLPHGQHITQ